MSNEEKRSMTFKVQSFRKIPNPYLKSENGEKSAEMYIAICDVKDIPDDIPMETNPREQKMTTNVAKKIKQSLLDTSEMNFYLLNRGILLSAKDASYNNYSNEMTISFEDFEVHGNVDGGHTYKTILQERDQLDYGQQYVKIEILVGVEGMFQSLAAARNTSVQVQDKSIAELEDRFDIIKNALAKEKYIDRVFFKENDSGDIDVADLLALLNMFNIDRYNGMTAFPINSYSSKKKCIDLYINDHKEYAESAQNPYVKMVSIMPDIFKLYDAIETKKLGGCALDVQECESLVINMRKDPLKIDNSDNNCLQKAMIIQKLAALDNVIITLHIAYNTTDAINTILAITFSNIRDYLKGLNTNRIV